ncbi:hypothetical protein GCM10009804_42620 [Kribbella hippodromi]|uniref:DUF5709 domain-containing protein n=1 Tax=Kribbella hippodromi TaxID=434347 RepID=A0ABN2DNP1_9ACTN
MPPSGPDQVTDQVTARVTKQGRDHAGEDTIFAGIGSSVIHRGRRSPISARQAALVPEDEELPEDELPDELFAAVDEDEEDDEESEDEEPDDDEPDEPELDDSDFAGTELLPDERLSVR